VGTVCGEKKGGEVAGCLGEEGLERSGRGGGGMADEVLADRFERSVQVLGKEQRCDARRRSRTLQETS
jgi:hypothetical protein